MTTIENYNTQMTLLPEGEKKGSKKTISPTFISYNILKIASIRKLFSEKKENKFKSRREKQIFPSCFIFGTYWTAPFLFNVH